MTGQALAESRRTKAGAALQEALAAATWPDGSLLIDLAPEVLEERLLPALLSALDDADREELHR